ncbi:MAG: plasmid pRiA4b ORF-3 family protein [Dehalococcoidia bacterium]|nr:plasmid pRiA4b ORF-3 family protein [Dehalococcoidia bacterium]
MTTHNTAPVLRNTRNLVYQFKVALKEIKPPIWRRIVVPASYSFWDLHVAIQDSMGWLDCHLHAFRILNPNTGNLDEIGIPDEDAFEDDIVYLPGWQLSIAAYFRQPGDRADYLYDFGDNWEHEIVLEGILLKQPKTKYPRCLEGAGACPPEDCGGAHGYADLLDILRDPSHPEHESMMEWVGGRYDPHVFDPVQVRFDNPKKRWQFAFEVD